MKRASVAFVGTLVVVFIAGIALSRKSTQAPKTATTETNETVSAQSRPVLSLSATPAVTPNTAAAVGKSPLIKSNDPQQEHQTIEAFSDIFAAAHEAATPASLVRELQRAGLSPIGSRDSDEITGSMIVVETENALPGSRYFRAQFFSDEQGVYQLQHMSYELKPGTSVDEVVGQLNRSLGPLPHMSYTDAEWKAWKLPGHYTLSIKKLNQEDVTETALHAYSASDVGTLRVAIEADLPGHDDEPL